MQAWITHVLAGEHFGLAVYPAVFLLGLLGSLSSCCTLPVLGAVAGYAGSRGTTLSRRELYLTGLAFMLGTMLALAALGALTGFVGAVANTALGAYWRLAAGLLLVAFGLASLGLVPLRLPSFMPGPHPLQTGVAGAMLYGLLVGGASTACSVGCNPLLAMVIGATALKGATLLGALIFATFAFGFSLPLAAGIIGIGLGLGRVSQIAARLMPVIRIAAGGLLVGVGFYLLATIR